MPKSKFISLTKPKSVFIVGIGCSGNKNIEYTHLIKLALIVFQKLNLNCGPSKSTLMIPSQLDFFFFCKSDEVAICGVSGGRVH